MNKYRAQFEKDILQDDIVKQILEEVRHFSFII